MDINAVLPIISVGVAILAFYFARKNETKDDTVQTTEMMVELRGMRGDISEIKDDFKAIRSEIKADHENIVIMKRDVETMWKRVDELRDQLLQTKNEKEKENGT